MKEPIVPKIATYLKTEYFYCNYTKKTLADLIAQLPKGISYDAITVTTDEDSIGFMWDEPESDSSYNKKMEKYIVKKQEYDDWYELNKEEIIRKKRLELSSKLKEVDEKRKTIIEELEHIQSNEK